MNLTKSQKVWIGIGTLIVTVMPFLWMMSWMALAVLPFIGFLGGNEEEAAMNVIMIFGVFFSILIPFFMLISFLSLGMHIFYIIHVIKNERGLDALRIILTLGFQFMPYLAYPIYYFVYIWPERPPAGALKPSAAAI